jgi:hypothetical protein
MRNLNEKIQSLIDMGLGLDQTASVECLLVRKEAWERVEEEISNSKISSMVSRTVRDRQNFKSYAKGLETALKMLRPDGELNG